MSVSGSEQYLAAPASPDCMPQLLPNLYEYCQVIVDDGLIPSTTVSAGLIDSLQLLLAMAASSAPADSLAHALDCIQTRFWRPHGISNGRSMFCPSQSPINLLLIVLRF